ncbi:hypothetical protein EVAR_81143_1 [Eumeta japonica]|uniref:Uncharacterized protein n=1 Tax=Eumeta variegata TaxID=151549 RepID=A0A4C1UK20_EUMVA|nr:hypothetical protein EVAR_81143_1 [Eumeta japonica]
MRGKSFLLSHKEGFIATDGRSPDQDISGASAARWRRCLNAEIQPFLRTTPGPPTPRAGKRRRADPEIRERLSVHLFSRKRLMHVAPPATRPPPAWYDSHRSITKEPAAGNQQGCVPSHPPQPVTAETANSTSICSIGDLITTYIVVLRSMVLFTSGRSAGGGHHRRSRVCGSILRGSQCSPFNNV